MRVTGTYDPNTNQTLWGVGNPVPKVHPRVRPGDNFFTNSVVSWDPDSGRMNWYFQYTPGDMWDYDEVGTHILFDRVIDGQARRLVTHLARNGFVYTMERANGAMVGAKPDTDVNWTAGIDQKTGSSMIIYKDVHLIGPRLYRLYFPVKQGLPINGGNNGLPVILQSQDPAALHSRHDGMRIRVHRQGQAEDRKG